MEYADWLSKRSKAMNKHTFILGVSALYHDSSACLIKDGQIVAAAQEERFTRLKHDASFPINAIKYCFQEANIEPSEVQNVVFYEKPFLKFERLLETYLAYAPRGFASFSKAIPVWIKDKLFQKSMIISQLKKSLCSDTKWEDRILFSEHHLSHAASAFYPSPFESAAVLTIDGVGEWSTASVAIGKGNKLKIFKEINFPHSLGLFYSAFTYHTGFKVNSGEYKLMGLAPYGSPIYSEVIKENLIKIADDGSFRLDMSYFDFATGLKMTNKKFDKLFKSKPRKPEDKITQREMDMAASVQLVAEEIIIKIANNILLETGEKNLCLAGGVALNCVANGKLLRENIFENIWIQPAAGDAGGAIGAALTAWYQLFSKQRKLTDTNDSMKGSFLGPSFSDEEIHEALTTCEAKFTKLSESLLMEEVLTAIESGKAVGWMQGRMEFGPRSLGARSIIADPRSKNMQKKLNLKVKYRESFRPFAPSILFEEVENWFDHKTESPYMLFVSNVRHDKRVEAAQSEKELFGVEKLSIQRSVVPAITHVDYSARVQTVHKETNPKFHKLIKLFKERTGCPLLVNTSFNVRGEPIVCTPEDAFNCFMGTDIDVLVIENFLLYKNDQKVDLFTNHRNRYDLD